MFVALAKLDHAVRLELGPDQRKLGRLQLIPQRVLGVFLGRGGKSHGVDVNSVHHTRQSKGSQIQGPPTTLWCGGGSAAQSGHSAKNDHRSTAAVQWGREAGSWSKVSHLDFDQDDIGRAAVRGSRIRHGGVFLWSAPTAFPVGGATKSATYENKKGKKSHPFLPVPTLLNTMTTLLATAIAVTARSHGAVTNPPPRQSVDGNIHPWNVGPNVLHCSSLLYLLPPQDPISGP